MKIRRIWFKDPPGADYRALWWRDEHGDWCRPKGVDPHKGTDLLRACSPMLGEARHPEDVWRPIIVDCMVATSGQVRYKRAQGISDPVYIEMVRRLETGAYDDVPAYQDIPVPAPSRWAWNDRQGLFRVGEPRPGDPDLSANHALQTGAPYGNGLPNTTPPPDAQLMGYNWFPEGETGMPEGGTATPTPDWLAKGRPARGSRRRPQTPRNKAIRPNGA